MSSEEVVSGSLELKKIPNTALQAIYHAVTRKTENLAKTFNGDVIVEGCDIAHLYKKISDQVEHYVPASQRNDGADYFSTTTIVIKNGEGKTTTFSSWGKYKLISSESHEVTSEINIKIEFLVHLTNTPQPQRCVINISIDSALPLLVGRYGQGWSDEFLDLLFMLRTEWKTVDVSIEFVDFLLAKNFMNIVEDWFKGLKKTSFSKVGVEILKRYGLARSIFSQVGKLCVSVFLLTYVFFDKKAYISNIEIIKVSSIAIIMLSIFSVTEGMFIKLFFKRLISNIIPSVLLITNKDKELYGKIIDGKKSIWTTIVLFILASIFSLVLNVVASYIYAYMQ